MAEVPNNSRGRAHVFPVRVYYEDTDAGGVVYYANYLKMAERARTEMLRDSGQEHGRLLAEHGVMFAVRRGEADYLRKGALRREGGQVVLDLTRSRTDMVMIYLGVAFGR